MPTRRFRPTSPGRRGMIRIVTPGLHKGGPFEPLTLPKCRGSGRNNMGRITVRHRGGGHKSRRRIVDFKRNKDGIPATVVRIEYDPGRSANLALVCYRDGEYRYILAPKGVAPGAILMSGSEAPVQAGNAMLLRNIPVGSSIHCIEMEPGKGGQLARSAGASVRLLARDGVYAQLRLRSDEIRKVRVECRATIGEIGNEEHNLRAIGKAGANRWRGIRPTVRGIAMNPVDHPHGGRSNGGGHPRSPWGWKTKGYKTRRRKNNSMILQSRARARARG